MTAISQSSKLESFMSSILSRTCGKKNREIRSGNMKIGEDIQVRGTGRVLLGACLKIFYTHPLAKIDFDVEVVIENGNSVLCQLNVAFDEVGAASPCRHQRPNRILANVFIGLAFVDRVFVRCACVYDKVFFLQGVKNSRRFCYILALSFIHPFLSALSAYYYPFLCVQLLWCRPFASGNASICSCPKLWFVAAL